MMAGSTGSCYFSSGALIRCNWTQLLIVLAQFHASFIRTASPRGCCCCSALGARRPAHHVCCGGLRHRVVLLVPV